MRGRNYQSYYVKCRFCSHQNIKSKCICVSEFLKLTCLHLYGQYIQLNTAAAYDSQKHLIPKYLISSMFSNWLLVHERELNITCSLADNLVNDFNQTALEGLKLNATAKERFYPYFSPHCHFTKCNSFKTKDKGQSPVPRRNPSWFNCSITEVQRQSSITLLTKFEKVIPLSNTHFFPEQIVPLYDTIHCRVKEKKKREFLTPETKISILFQQYSCYQGKKQYTFLKLQLNDVKQLVLH